MTMDDGVFYRWYAIALIAVMVFCLWAWEHRYRDPVHTPEQLANFAKELQETEIRIKSALVAQNDWYSLGHVIREGRRERRERTKEKAEVEGFKEGFGAGATYAKK